MSQFPVYRNTLLYYEPMIVYDVVYIQAMFGNYEGECISYGEPHHPEIFERYERFEWIQQHVEEFRRDVLQRKSRLLDF